MGPNCSLFVCVCVCFERKVYIFEENYQFISKYQSFKLWKTKSIIFFQKNDKVKAKVVKCYLVSCFVGGLV